jgi:lysophospholipase L1-like esterase
MVKKVILLTFSTMIGVSIAFNIATYSFISDLRGQIGKENRILRETQHNWIMLRPYGIWSLPYTKGETNYDGFRIESTVDINKPEDEFRIALLGGSSVYGHGVPSGQTISHFMEKTLGTNSRNKIRVLNFGMPGYTSSNELVLLVLKVMLYKPDFVIILDGWNDIHTRGYIPHHGYFINLYKNVLDQANLGLSTSEVAVRNVLGSTRVGNLAIKLILDDYKLSETDPFYKMKNAAKNDIERGVGSNIDWPPTVYLENIINMAGVLKMRAIPHLILFQPHNYEKSKDQDEYYKLIEASFFLASDKTGSPSLSMKDFFRKSQIGDSIFMDNVHFTAKGNSVMAKVICILMQSLIDRKLPLKNGKISLNTSNIDDGQSLGIDDIHFEKP